MRKFVSAFLAVLILLGCANVFVLAADEGLTLQTSTDTDIPAPAPEPTAAPEVTPAPIVPDTPTDIPTPTAPPEATPAPGGPGPVDPPIAPDVPDEPVESEDPYKDFVHGTPIVIPPDEDDVIDFTPFEGKTWEEIIDTFFTERGVDPESLAFGYYNTVTGEEFYHNGDMYMVAASVYKLPLNMYYAEMVYEGEIEWSTTYGNIPYEKIQRSSIESSNNELSELLQFAIGDYREYRAAIAPILGVNTRTVEERYYQGNDFTPEQIISALKKLYSDPERYPRVEEYMFLGAPNNYFSYSEHRYRIAHKYGYLTYEGHNYFNDAAIVYTPDPILLVMFMDNTAGAINTMTDYCTLMCDYSEYTRHLREEAEANATPEPEQPVDTPDVQETPAAQETPAVQETTQPSAAPAPQTPVPAPSTAVTDEEFELTNVHKLLIVMAAAGIPAVVLIVLRKRHKAIAAAAVVLVMVFGVAAVALATLGIGSAVNGGLDFGKEEPVQTAAPAPTPTPTPTPTPSAAPEITEYTVTDESAEEILALAEHESLSCVDGSASGEYAALAKLSRLLPDCEVIYSVELYGMSVGSDATEITVDDFTLSDTQPLMDALAYLPAVERVDIREMTIENEQAEALIEAYPNIDFVWTVNVGKWHVSTEATCFSTRQESEPKERFTSEDFAPLFKYCTDLVALDLSRNDISSLEGIENLSKLKVLMLGDNSGITDISPIAKLTELEFLELYRTSATDYSCLAELEKLTDLNLAYCGGLTEYSFIGSLENLERAWLRGSGIPGGEWNNVLNSYPDVTILFWHESMSPTAGAWRSNERSIAIRKAFENWEYVTAFNAWDDVEYRAEYNLTPVYNGDG